METYKTIAAGYSQTTDTYRKLAEINLATARENAAQRNRLMDVLGVRRPVAPDGGP